MTDIVVINGTRCRKCHPDDWSLYSPALVGPTRVKVGEPAFPLRVAVPKNGMVNCVAADFGLEEYFETKGGEYVAFYLGCFDFPLPASRAELTPIIDPAWLRNSANLPDFVVTRRRDNRGKRFTEPLVEQVYRRGGPHLFDGRIDHVSDDPRPYFWLRPNPLESGWEIELLEASYTGQDNPASVARPVPTMGVRVFWREAAGPERFRALLPVFKDGLIETYSTQYRGGSNIPETDLGRQAHKLIESEIQRLTRAYRGSALVPANL